MSAIQNNPLHANEYFVTRPGQSNCCLSGIKLCCSPLGIIFTLLCCTRMKHNVTNSTTFDFSKHHIDPVAKERFNEMEKRTHTCALKMGIKHPENIQAKL